MSIRGSGRDERKHWFNEHHHLTRADRDFLTDLATRKIGKDPEKMADFRRWLGRRTTTKGDAAQLCKRWGETFPM